MIISLMLHYIDSLQWYQWKWLSWFKISPCCAWWKWGSLCCIICFYFLHELGKKKDFTSGWKQSTWHPDCVLCSVTMTGIFQHRTSSDTYTMCSRKEKKKKPIVILPISSISPLYKILCNYRFVHDVLFSRKEQLTSANSYYHSHWPLISPTHIWLKQ